MDLGPRASPFSPYGPWTTIALAVAVDFGASVAAWFVVTAFGGAVNADKLDDAAFTYSILADLITIAAILKLTSLRAPGQVSSYLALRPFRREAALHWFGIAAALMLSEGMIQSIIRGIFDMPYETNAFDTVSPGLSMVVAVVLVGPIAEEVMFRGFVMEGLIPTRVGQSGALVLSTLAWALLHTQYDAVSTIMVFALGILFGLARLASGSLLLSIVLHMVWNGFTVLFRLG